MRSKRIATIAIAVALICTWLLVYLAISPIATPTPAGRDYTVPDTVSTVNGTGNFEHVQPGDRLLIPSSRTGPITLKNLKGEEGNKIIIVNSGGKVGINANGSWAGVQIRNCEHVRLTGTGDPSVEYGFEIYNSSNCGITAYSRTRYMEIDHVEIRNVAKAGMYAKTPEDIRDTWTQYGTYIHHNYVHDVGNEGLYVGSSSWAGGKEPELEGVEISYNRIERCGYDGIQVGSAVADVKVHHNFVKDIGLEKPYGGGCAKAGFVINKGTTGDFYNNMIVNTGRWGFVILGLGHYRIYNNIIADAGGKPGSSDDAGIRWLGAGVQDGLFYNNTIVRTRGDGIKVTAGWDGAIYDNIVLGSSGINIINKNAAKYNNIESGAVGAVGFVDPDSNDFHLLPSSSAVDAGSDTGFAPFDYDHVPRPQGSASDIGAFEHVSSLPPTPTNTPPLTGTPTPTATNTPLPTFTPTPTNTPTLLPTNTPTPTGTPTPTSSPGPGPTVTPTATGVPTVTPEPKCWKCIPIECPP